MSDFIRKLLDQPIVFFGVCRDGPLNGQLRMNNGSSFDMPGGRYRWNGWDRNPKWEWVPDMNQKSAAA